MSEPDKQTSWWQTLPGVLTALAAAITAISGLVAILFQHGVFGTAAANVEAPPVPQVTTTSTMSPEPSASVAVKAAPKAPKPWSDAEAVILARDGTTTRVRATSLSNCISANHEISLIGGQTIAFEKMSGIEVTQADDHANSDAKAKLKLKLSNGTEIVGMVEANCDIFGLNELGRYTTYFDQIRSISFE